MRKILCAVLAAVMLLCAASCGKTPENGEKMKNIIITDEKYGAVPDDEKDDSQNIMNAISAAGGKPVCVVIPNGEYRISQNISIPGNVTLFFDKGAYFYTDKDVTVTLDGCRIESSVQQLFAGEGKYDGHCPGEAYVQWLGATANGRNVSDRIQMAVDIFDTVKLTPGSSNWAFDDVNITKPTTVVGEGQVRINVYHSSKKNVFNISSGGVAFKNLNFIGNGGNKGSAVFYFDTSKCSMSGISIFNCFGQSNGHVIKDAENGTNHVSDFTMEVCAFTHCYEVGICTSDFSDGLVFKDVVIDNVGFPVEISWAGWHMKNVTGAFMDNVDAAGGLGIGSGADGFIFENCRNIEIPRAMQDYVNGTGLVIKNCSDLHFSNFICSLYEGCGIYMENVTDSTFDMMVANGIYPTIKTKDTRGWAYEAIKLVKCSGVTFNNLTMTDNQSDGMTVEDSDHITVNSLVYVRCNGNCLIESGTSDFNTYNGIVCCANHNGKNASAVLTGNSSRIIGASFNNKDAVSAVGPATLK